MMEASRAEVDNMNDLDVEPDGDLRIDGGNEGQ